MTDDTADEIERLRNRCEAYKGQVESGAAEIAALKARVAELEATLSTNPGEQ
jgi:prefoldin subunit 5